MSAMNIQMRLGMILTKAEIERLRIKAELNELKIFADVHGMKCQEAKKFIENIIALLRVDFTLVVIHGFNHGTAIKDMISESTLSNRVTRKEEKEYNKGLTYMYIAA